ncbi:sigma-54-dependent transcriptional regulator [Psychrobacter pygoscelis]|uniref:sigma-54-dependent transcriptional regulator n=1 Tax=Psychrobacter pygoscelis TaxID=2488563 RepID=UPI00103A7B84|nr:sigma-54 dependent transcriptional regulator [Psychrobacter pygoscelis]
MSAIALIVDDEADLCRLMQITLTKMGIMSHIAYDLASANNYLDQFNYDFCLTDLRLPDGSGLDLVKRISSTTSTPVAVITAHGSIDLAIKALKLGAFDFVNKPLELPKLRQLVENALKVTEQAHLPANADQKSPEQQLLDQRLIGDSAIMTELKATIVKLARSQAPVFLCGESGTGKEVVARLIHDLSPRREGNYVAVNCGAIPSELMESEFFGHKKGSFTGATTDKLGLFQQANSGTLFLDEVADLPLAMQVKLLRAIQEKSIRAVGDNKELPVDVRIISATHKDLAKLVQTNAFRQDLFYRINVIELKLPTLNERINDIPTLARHFLALISKEWQLDETPKLTEAACERLKSHDFEGNVRELRNLLERAVTLTESSLIDVDHLGIADNNHNSLTKIQPTVYDAVSSAAVTADAAEPISFDSALEYPYLNVNSQGRAAKLDNAVTEVNLSPSSHSRQRTSSSENSTSLTTSDTSSLDNLPEEGLEAYLQAQEKTLIITALQQTGWNKTKAAELLGTTFRSLRYRMKKLDIEESENPEMKVDY